MERVGRTSLIIVFKCNLPSLLSINHVKSFFVLMRFLLFFHEDSKRKRITSIHSLILTFLPCRPFLSFAFPVTRLYSRDKF